MWIKAGYTLLNRDKIKLLSIDPDNVSGTMSMRLHAFVEGIEEPVVLAMTPPVGDADYNKELLALKSYLEAVHKGIAEEWTTYELGEPVSGFPSDEGLDFSPQMDAVTKTIELARVRHEALETGDKAKSEVERRRLEAHIGSLTHSQRGTILALCWFGRGDFEQYASAVKQTATFPPGDIAGYLSDKFPLDEYLNAGVQRISGAA